MFVSVYTHTHTHTHTHTQCPQMTDDNIHWFSIVNSIVILVFLTGIVALIMLRILRKVYAYTINACMYTLAYAYTRMPRCHRDAHGAPHPAQGIHARVDGIRACMYAFQFQFQFVYSQPIRIEAVREQDPI